METDQPRPTHQLENAQGGTNQDTETIRPTEAHSLPEDRTGRDKSGHGKNTTDRAHSPTRGRTWRDKSGHRKNPIDRGPLTIWRPHREVQIRTWKESDRPRPTHRLETAQGGTNQGTERIRPTEAHSQTGDRTGGTSQDTEIIRPTEAHLPAGDHTWKDESGHGKNLTNRCPLTNWRPHREGQVRTRKQSDRLRPTHKLETAQGGTSQCTEIIRPTEAHSPTGDRTWRDKSGHRKNPTDRDPLTDWRPHMEGQVRAQKESDRPRPTHFLETAHGGTSQDTERI